MRILVVCGAGASSTFVAQRVRRAAQERGLPYTAFAGAEQSLPIDLDAADIVLVGPHLAPDLERIAHLAAAHAVRAVLLPDDVFTDRTGERTLALLLSALADETPRGRTRDMSGRSRTVRIGSANGLHARPAKLFAQAAKDAGMPVTIAKDAGAPVNAASILAVIALGIEYGDYVTLTADGAGADATLDTLAELLTTDHDTEA